MDGRPDFSQIKSFEEFSKYYWYREELQKICKGLGLDSRGMKAELNLVIQEYFKGNKIAPKTKASPKARGAKIAGRGSGAVVKHCAASKPKNRVAAKLSLSTGLIECGFTFGPRFRDFFSTQTGVAKFKFNVDMVATAKKVKQDGDTSFTLGDLLDIYYGKKTYAKYDKVCLQWNKFVQDFCADPASAAFPNKLKAAAALWKQVRDSTRPKVYTHELLAALK